MNTLLRFLGLFCVLLLVNLLLEGQVTTESHLKDSITTFPPSQVTHRRIKYVLASNLAAYGGTMVALYDTWYKHYPQSHFHFFNDNAEWLQVDKIGHAWSAYNEGRASIALWKWAGLSPNKSVWIGGLSGLAYQSIIEVLDGFSAEWGFSWGDYLGNAAGTALLISQELGWHQQRIQFKFSAHRNSYGNPLLNARADDIYGKNLPERLLKDYNAQTYWLSVNLKSFFKTTGLPPWLNVAVGYGAEGMMGALNNIWMTKAGITVDRTDIIRYRQFYLAPDIDLTKIKTKRKWLKSAFFLMNSLKLPTPSLEFNKKGLAWNWVHF